MKHVFIAGNWKSNKTVDEAMEWMDSIRITTSAQVILFAPFTLLYPLKQRIASLRLPIELGAQDVSPFGDGAYTGEVNARQIKELCRWVLIGHSERRHHFVESDELLEKKVQQAKASGLSVIYCVPDDTTAVPSGVDVVAYEPVWAIGTGKSDTPENARQVIATIKTKLATNTVIYGGSVTPETSALFVAQDAIDGVLVGGASLDAQKFSTLIGHAASVTL